MTLQRKAPMKRSAIARQPAPPAPERQRQPTVLYPATRRASYAGTTGDPQPKSPHTVNPHFRNLARGEACTGLRYGGYCHCDPLTTVLAHTNSQADNKGMGYKADDHRGAFLGHDCHAWLDQGGASEEEAAAFMAAAQERTLARLRELVATPTIKPWRRDAAQWALDQHRLSTAPEAQKDGNGNNADRDEGSDEGGSDGSDAPVGARRSHGADADTGGDRSALDRPSRDRERRHPVGPARAAARRLTELGS